MTDSGGFVRTGWYETGPTDAQFHLIEAYRNHNRDLVLAFTVTHCERARQDLPQQMEAG
ncbi:MAG TPA: hypothetical protein VIZ17_10325 [Acetobacteraceae bacterium]